ncbi:DUF721 domain-containing protein [Pseudomonadota bacterium]
MWSPIQDLIPKAARKYKIAKTMEAIEVCREYKKIAPQILTEKAEKNTFPKSYKNGILTIGVSSSAWAQKLHMHRSDLKKSLEERLGEGAIKKIKIQTSQKEN